MATFDELKKRAIEEIVSSMKSTRSIEKRRESAEFGINSQLRLVREVHEKKPELLDERTIAGKVKILASMQVNPKTADAMIRAYIAHLRGQE